LPIRVVSAKNTIMSEETTTGDVQASGDVQSVTQDGLTIRFGTSDDQIKRENHERAKANVDAHRSGLTAFPVRINAGYTRD